MRRCRRCTWPVPASGSPRASSAACWSTTRPATGIVGAEGGGGAHDLVAGRRCRAAARPASPNRASSSGSQRPLSRSDQQRSTRGGRVGDELAAELVDQPAVGGGDHAVGGDVAAQPGHLRCGEVRVEHEAGALRRPSRVWRPARATIARRGGPARRWRGTAGGRWHGSQASTVSPWLARDTPDDAAGRPGQPRAGRRSARSQASSRDPARRRRPAGRWDARNLGYGDDAVDRVDARSPWYPTCLDRSPGSPQSSPRQLRARRRRTLPADLQEGHSCPTPRMSAACDDNRETAQLPGKPCEKIDP